MKEYLYYIYWIVRTWPMRWRFPRYNILSFEDTVNEIIVNKKSISRFGDGEFRLLTKERGIYFQDLNNKIAERLHEVLNSNLSNHLVCIPSSFNTKKDLKRVAKIHWLNFINQKGKNIKKAIENPSRIFGDAFISRFYQDFIDKREVPAKVKLLKQIWHNESLLLIEGEFSRLGVGNDLFNNAKSIERIICPAENAFKKYEQILLETKKCGKSKLIIIALGPTATILAHDLAKENYWALDLGHFDIEYIWYMMKATEKVAVGNKKSAEIVEDHNFNLSVQDQIEYDLSIICKIV